MSDTPSRLHELVEKHRSGKTRPRFPEELQRRVTAYVHKQRAKNVPYIILSKQIGLSATALAKWAQKYPPPATGDFLPVRVVAAPSALVTNNTISITSPNGWNIKGLDIHGLIAVIGNIT